MITSHFSLKEFAVSADFPDLAARICFNEVQKERIRFACASILEPLRHHFSKPVIISSGKRTPELNHAVGGHPQSDHLYLSDSGAVDIVVPRITAVTVADWLVNNVVTKTVIAYSDRGFVHISFPDSSGIINKLRIKG